MKLTTRQLAALAESGWRASRPPSECSRAMRKLERINAETMREIKAKRMGAEIVGLRGSLDYANKEVRRLSRQGRKQKA